MALGDLKEHKRPQGSQSGIVSLGSFLFQSQIVLWTSPFLACPTGGTSFHYGHGKALSETGGDEGKSAKLTGVKRW